MKKYFIISIIINILLSVLAFFGFINYLVLSASKSYSSLIDLIVLLLVVIIDIIINYVIYKLVNKTEKNRIFILIPSGIFMLITGILFLFVR